MEIRKATIEDLKRVQELCSFLFDYEYNKDNGDKSLDLDWIFKKSGEDYIRDAITGRDSCVFVAVDDSVIVGYVEGGIFKPEEYRKIPKMVRLEFFYVLEEFRGKGIGDKLYEAFVEWAKEKGAKSMSVEVTTSNSGAMKFYKKNGFGDYHSVLEMEI
jgi:ribosomal protein S18 acetylase RimI-like enzyme